MAEIVHSSFGRKYRSREMAALHGFALTDVVIPSTTRLVEDSEGNLATGNLNAFDYVSASGLDVTIDTGEAIVDGGYLASDEQHTVTVSDDATTTVFIGWKDGQADTIIVGLLGDFTSDDHKTAIWDIAASGGSVDSQSDQRNTDSFRIANEVVEALVNISGSSFSAYPIEAADIASNAVGANELNVDTGDIPEGSNLYYTNERTRDAIGAALVGGTDISITVDDAADIITIDGADTQLTTEEVEDIVGALIGAGSDISVNYDDAGDSLTISVDTSNLDADTVDGSHAADLQDPTPLYGDGSDGAITRSSDANENGVIMATDYTVNSGVTMTVSTGFLVVFCTGTATIDGVIDASGQGAPGGAEATGQGGTEGNPGSPGNWSPKSLGGAGGSGATTGGDGGEGGDGNTEYSNAIDAIPGSWAAVLLAAMDATGAGAGGGSGGSGNDNQGSKTDGNPGTAPGGGGEGSETTLNDTSSLTGGAGGNGGGIALIVCDALQGSGTVQADGIDGADGLAPNRGAGGGGGGGSGGVAIVVTADDNSTVTATATAGAGGSGGNGVDSSGGDGAAGEPGVGGVISP